MEIPWGGELLLALEEERELKLRAGRVLLSREAPSVWGSCGDSSSQAGSSQKPVEGTWVSFSRTESHWDDLNMESKGLVV